jgi:argininosuccinate lyase
MMKGLPSGYNRDFHEDKEILVEIFNLSNMATSIIPALVETTTFNFARMAELPMANFSTATELANFLVSAHDVPFREAHHIVGSLVGKLVAQGKTLTAIDDVMAHLKERGVANANKAKVVAALDGKSVMMTYESRGGTGPKAVKTMIDQMEAQHAALLKTLDTDKSRVSNANATAHAIALEASKAANLSKDGLRAIVAKHHPLGKYQFPQARL